MQKWDKMTWEMLINGIANIAYKGDFFGAYVEDIKCSKCKRDIEGAIFFDKKKLFITDSWNFMVFDKIVCDDCIKSSDWLGFVKFHLRNIDRPYRYVQDSPENTVNFMAKEEWGKLIKSYNKKYLALLVSGFKCDTCGKKIQGVVFMDLKKGIDAVETWGFKIGEKVECCICGGFTDWKEKL